MKSVRSLLCAAAALASASVALAQGGNVVISQFYGGGGFQPSGPVYDCVELFNRTGAPINLNGWSLQVQTGTAAWTVIPLNGTIPARGFYLIQTGTSFDVNVGVPLTFDAAASPLLDTSAFTSGAGRCALLNDTVQIGSGVCPIGQANLIDLLSVGTSTFCAEGGVGAPGGSTAANPPTNTVRKLSGCQDTNNNAADFETQTPPNMRNSSSPALPGSDFVAGAASPSPAPAGTSTTITVNMQSCGGTPVSVTSIVGDFSAFGLSNAEAFTGSGVGPWTYVLNVPANQASGQYSVNVTASDGVTTYPGVVAFRTSGAAPANDLCSNATLLSSLPTTFSVDNSAATADVDPGTCNTGTQGNFGVWYRYDATQNGLLTITESSTQAHATGVWVVPTASAACPTTSTGATCSTAASLIVPVSPGNSYYIQVGASGTATPTVNLDIGFSFEAVTAPANDECVNATLFTGGVQNYVVDNRAAQNDVDPGTCNTGTVGNRGVWYRFDATQNGILTVAENSTQTAAIGIWTSSTCPTASTGATCSTATSVATSVVAGSTYYIQVGTSGTALPTVPLDITLTFEAIIPPANDECANAITLGTLPQNFVIDNRGAANDVDPGTCNTGTVGNRGVWFIYNATQNGSLNINEVSTQTVAYGIWSFPTGSGSCPVDSTGATCSTTQNFSFPVTAGNTYYIQIGTSSTTVPTVSIDATFTFQPPAPNDTCATATTITVPSIVNGTGATATDDADITCNSTTNTVARRGVWYTYTTGADAGTLVYSETGSNDVAVAVFDGTCGLLNQIFCADAEANQNVLLQANTTYYILVSMWSSTTVPASDYVMNFSAFNAATGACCNGTTCTVTTGSACTGTFLGANVTCNPGPSFSEPASVSVPDYTAAPPAAPTPVSSTIVVSANTIITDLKVTFTANHLFGGDLYIRLQGPNNTIVDLFRRPGTGAGGCIPGALGNGNDLVGTYVIDDAATTNINAALIAGPSPLASGSYKGSTCNDVDTSLNAAFAGLSVNGTWTLLISDEDEAVVGTVSNFGLIVNGGTVPCASSGNNAVCCIGATCTVTTQANCTASGTAGATFVSGSSTCNSAASATSPCCYANYNKIGGIEVNDIFDFLNDWFAGSNFADTGGNGTTAPDVNSIFDFLNAWFAGGC